MLPEWPASAAVEAEAEAAQEPVRSGERGDVPVWPPRLPGEAVHDEDAEGDDPPVVPRHWPPTESPGPTLRPWSAPGRLPAASETEPAGETLPSAPEPDAPVWPSAVGAHASSETTITEPSATEALATEPGTPAAREPEPVGQHWPSFGSWPSLPEARVAEAVPAEELDGAEESHEVVPETSAGVPSWPEARPEDQNIPDSQHIQDTQGSSDSLHGQGSPDSLHGQGSSDGRDGSDGQSSLEAPDGQSGSPDEAQADERDQVTLPGERESGLTWPAAESTEWPPGPGRWRSAVPMPPPDEETVAETTIPRREVMFPVTDATPPPLRRIHGENTPAEGIVLPPVPQQQAYRQQQLPPPAKTEERSSGGAGRKAVLALCSVIVVGAIGTAAYFAYTDAGDPASAGKAPTVTGAPAVSAEAPDPAPVTAAVLDSEATDPRKLTLAEAFPDARISVDGRTFRRVKVNITDKCEDAAAGAFAEALAQQQCRRVLRATYVDNRKQYAVTTGIAVLPTKEAALEVDKTKNLGGNLWFRGLDGDPDTGADRVSISGGYAAGMVWGRYIVFSYATYADGHTPVEKEKDLGPVSGAFRDHTAEIIEKRIADS
ncbi:hypothetical protein [Acrocarpospora pleiomorpha]|uniref:hypothetical protein n=1 Tax=Acrocarpospora pleiomorpha TaxID=90975 RepID=UPI0031D11DB3